MMYKVIVIQKINMKIENIYITCISSRLFKPLVVWLFYDTGIESPKD